MQRSVFILADDLTGAADSAVAFAQRGYCAHVQLSSDVDQWSEAEVVAHSTESRDLPEQQLFAQLRLLHAVNGQQPLLFKKIDSMLRGNTFAEIALIARMLPDTAIVISPAFPKLGRRCHNGQLHWVDAAGQGTEPLHTELSRRGVEAVLLPCGSTLDRLATQLQACGSPGHPRVFLHEASTDVEMQQIVGAASRLRCPVLWVGSGGLAHALAEQLSPGTAWIGSQERKQGRVLFFVGSQHPVTRLQVRELQHYSATAAANLIEVPRGVATEFDIVRETEAISPADLGCVVMTGGDTAMLVCRALHVTSLRIEGEFAPGVPVTRLQGGRLDGVQAILKSGGFGTPDLLCNIEELYGSGGRVAA